MIRGPQPETVRDYVLEARLPGGRWQELASVQGNFYRLRRHSFPPVETEAIRLRIKATNGDPLARVFEIRCYA
jgi:hypothetical protein